MPEGPERRVSRHPAGPPRSPWVNTFKCFHSVPSETSSGQVRSRPVPSGSDPTHIPGGSSHSPNCGASPRCGVATNQRPFQSSRSGNCIYIYIDMRRTQLSCGASAASHCKTSSAIPNSLKSAPARKLTSKPLHLDCESIHYCSIPW
ncbi:hypothetical protein LX32DRAFT_414526 [Colletotrichum zoysiae]|uniref:Uncharacterized protein n=1 Tax=Colletotrichum zoysiae TaxID=1216348 RepID=A0AAD9HHS5_9PEZI|nr:hypothetical protein LX32DRAFT_414526 [Colletotrichum zoysiae]